MKAGKKIRQQLEEAEVGGYVVGLLSIHYSLALSSLFPFPSSTFVLPVPFTISLILLLTL